MNSYLLKMCLFLNICTSELLTPPLQAMCPEIFSLTAPKTPAAPSLPITYELSSNPSASPIIYHEKFHFFNTHGVAEHAPRIYWQGNMPDRKTKYVTVLIHGMAESPLGMDEIAKEYQKFGNVWSPTLTGHGRRPEDFNLASYEAWMADISRAIRFAKTYLGHHVVLAGFSLGASLAFVHQYQHANHPGLMVSAVNLHSPLIEKSYTWNRIITEFRENAKKQNNTVENGGHNKPFYIAASDQYVTDFPVGLFDTVDKIESDFSKFKENPDLVANLVETNNIRLNAIFTLRDNRSNNQILKEILEVANKRKSSLVMYTEARMAHDQPIRRHPREPKMLEFKFLNPDLSVPLYVSDARQIFVRDTFTQLDSIAPH